MSYWSSTPQYNNGAGIFETKQLFKSNVEDCNCGCAVRLTADYTLSQKELQIINEKIAIKKEEDERKRLEDERKRLEEKRKYIESFIDLGLPSGTLWRKYSETGFYFYSDAYYHFGAELPSKDQMKELVDKCRWVWSCNGYLVYGPNGNSIFINAAGREISIKNLSQTYSEGEDGNYWTSTPGSKGTAYSLFFTHDCYLVSPNTTKSNKFAVHVVSKY